MATFTRRPNGFIYLVHSIDPNYKLRISTMMRIEDSNDWDKKAHQPKNLTYQYQGATVSVVLARYMNAFTKTLVLADNLTRESASKFRIKLFSFLSPEDMAGRETVGDLIEYFEKYDKKLKANKQSNQKSYHSCLNHLKTFRKNRATPFNSVNYSLYEKFVEFLTKENLSLNSIATMITRLKTVMKKASLEGLHTIQCR
jgi:hypothetical protein